LIGDPSNVQWTATQKQAKIQEWQERFVVDTKALKDVQTVTLISGTAEYDLPTDILDVIRVSHNGLKLERMSEFDMDVANDSDWASESGTPKKYLVDIDPNNKKIRVYPIPQGADTSASLIIEFVKIPPVLSTDAAVPFDSHTLLTPYHMAIAYGAAADLLRPSIRSGTGAEAIVVQIREYERMYEKMVTDCIETFKALSESKPLTFAVGRYFKNL
jgi:hypothetical protein